MRIENDILEIANEACLRITIDSKTLSINQKLNLKDKATWGIILFIFFGAFLILIPYIKHSDTTSKIIGILIGGFLLILSIITLIKQFVDNLKVSKSNIRFRYNLKESSIPFDKSIKVNMKSETLKINRRTSTSYFIHITHYIKTSEKEIPILKFQMENSNFDKAIKLGNKITQLINEKLEI